MKKLSKTIVLTLIVYCIICLILYPERCTKSASDAIGLCLDVVIPSLFPFFVCSGILTSFGIADLSKKYLSGFTEKVFRISGVGAPVIFLGSVSGYPVGAKCAADLYSKGYLSKKEAERLSAFCNNSGPLFVIGAIGTMLLSSKTIGILLYISQLISALCVGVIFRFLNYENARLKCLPKSEGTEINIWTTFCREVENGTESILKVCGFIIIFSVFAATLPSTYTGKIFYAFLEITGGIKALLDIPLGEFKVPVISFFISFSGISVLAQVASVLTPRGLSLRPYILGKLIQGVMSFLITYAALKLLPIAVTASSEILNKCFLSPLELLKTGAYMSLWCIGAVIIAIIIAIITS